MLIHGIYPFFLHYINNSINFKIWGRLRSKFFNFQ